MTTLVEDPDNKPERKSYKGEFCPYQANPPVFCQGDDCLNCEIYYRTLSEEKNIPRG